VVAQGTACPPDGGMTAHGPRPCRSLALRAVGSCRASEGRRRLSTARPASLPLAVGARPPQPAPTASASSTTSPPLAGSTANRAAASFRGETRLLVPDCDRGLNSHRVSLRRPPDGFSSASDRGVGNGPRKALAIDRKNFRPDLSVAPALAKAGLLPYTDRIFGISFNTVQGDSRAHVMRS
jgi:hypothetical protein